MNFPEIALSGCAWVFTPEFYCLKYPPTEISSIARRKGRNFDGESVGSTFLARFRVSRRCQLIQIGHIMDARIIKMLLKIADLTTRETLVSIKFIYLPNTYISHMIVEVVDNVFGN